jgi:DNA repair exonuclease SbcCD nuclease subunit
VPKLVLMNDIHYSRTEPACRAPSYSLEILEKLHAVARIARKIGAPAIACTGDWFHRKGRVTFHEQSDLLAVLSAWRSEGIRPLGILGNHDIAGYGLDSMDTRAAGAFYHAKVLELLDLDPAVLEDSTGTIHVTGTSYFHGCDSSDEARVRMYGAPPPADRGALHVHLAHGALMLRGEFIEDFSSPEQLVTLLHKAGRLPDVITCGHLHFPEEPKKIPRPDGRGDVTFYRVGSVARTERGDLDRIPSALVLATAGRDHVAKVVPIGKPPAVSDVPPGDPRDPREHEERIREFAQKLREEAEVLSLEDNSALIRAIAERQGHGEKVIARVMLAIENVR